MFTRRDVPAIIAAMLTRTAVLALALLSARPAAAVNVQGVDVPDTLTVDGRPLVHNGSGVRKKFVVKVYLGSLFLEQRRKSADEVLAADETRVVRLHFMHDVSRDQMLDAFRDGFAANSPGQAAALAPKLAELAKALPKDVKEHALLSLTYVPSKGTTVVVEGGPPPVTIEGKEFNDALLRNWIGPKPISDDLKKKMLGG